MNALPFKGVVLHNPHTSPNLTSFNYNIQFEENYSYSKNGVFKSNVVLMQKIGQTGHTTIIRYREHMRSLKYYK